MITRNDLQGMPPVPRVLKDTILRVGGKNIHDEPMFRLVISEYRTIKAAGAWAQWKKGLSVDERGGLGIKEMRKMLAEGKPIQDVQEYLAERMNVAPESVIVGMVDRLLYQFTGFVLEKWKPAETFGSPEEWNAIRFGGESALGPYPEYGDYELCAGPTPYMPSCEQLEDAIRRTFKEIDNRPSSPMARMSQMMAEMDAAQEAEDRATLAKLHDAVHEDDMLYKTISLDAGKVRQERADAAGMDGHYGN